MFAPDTKCIRWTISLRVDILPSLHLTTLMTTGRHVCFTSYLAHSQHYIDATCYYYKAGNEIKCYFSKSTPNSTSFSLLIMITTVL